MQNFLSKIYLVLVLIFCCSYIFPDKTPDWKSVNTYLPRKLEFHKSAVEDFLEVCPGAEVYNLDDEIKIISTTPEKTVVFQEVNAGFRNNTLDWLEFVLNKEIEMSEIITVYGFPRFIDSEYSDELDYYNYDTFNVSTNKDHTLAKSITVFNVAETAYKHAKNINTTDSEKSKFFEVFAGLRPGFTTEEEFLKKYPDLLPYMEEDFDVNTSYTLIDELGGAKYFYKRAVLRFENGLLSWINLIPVNPELQTFLNNIKEKPKVENLDEDYDFYTFNNFILVVSKKYKKVNSIGIVHYDKRF